MHRIRVPRPALLAALAGAVACLATTAATPANAGTAAPAAPCTLNAPAKGSEVPASCVNVTAALDHLPAVGEQATLTVDITAQTAVRRAGLSVQLPPSFQLAGKNEAFSASRTDAFGQKTGRTLSLTPGTHSVKLQVKAVAAGPAQIQADANDVDDPRPERGAHGAVQLTVGQTKGSSSKDVSVTRGAATPADRQQAKGPATRPTPAKGSAGQVCISGSLGYQYQSAEDGTWNWDGTFTKPTKNGVVRNANVTLWGKATSSSGTQKLATGLTSGSDGSYNLCYTPSGSAMAQVWAQYSTESTSQWKVVDKNGSLYSTVSNTLTNVSKSQDLGALNVNAGQYRAWHTLDTLNKLWWNRGSSTGCWTSRQSGTASSPCTEMTFQWYPGSTVWPNWSPYTDTVQLGDATPDAEHIVLHESGHALMGKLYGGKWWPNTDCPSPHYLDKSSGPVCAWTEGFANAVAFHTLGDTKYCWETSGCTNYANDRNTTGMDSGDTVETRVATSLIDLWSQDDGGWEKTLNLMTKDNSSTFREYFLTDRKAAGLDTSTKARTILYNHTIDYGKATS
ncbi:mycolysin [Streptomyces sp. BPTC-684]|uniref:mycolysin n=1 Tax=Streptomyces sp. BPTC-684 TaxID=3043734 RepID=UPI0024B0A300|nr:mycolysin [Streptomyces sp. BPTC-684]WHM40921.1 mycolysin [Streptomyces sp. BPTC-684]